MSIFSFIKSHAALAGTVAVLAVAGGVIAGRAATAKPAAAPVSQVRSVTLVDVSTFRNGTSTVSADGIVQAHDQADLKAQIGGQIAVTDHAIGDYVEAGQTILELSNADIRAQLQSSQGALTVAAGTYTSSRQGAIDKVRSSYLAADTAVHSQVDQYILNTITPTPAVFSYVTDPALGASIREIRSDLTTRFIAWKAIVDGLSANSSDADIHAAIVTSEGNLDRISMLLDKVSSVLSNAANIALTSTLTSINTIQTVVSAARSTVSGSKTALVAAEASLEGAQGNVGSAAQAGVDIALANVRNLQAQLAKTIITAPISGRISALPLNTGEFASPGTLLATIVGTTNGLTVKAYASADDLARVRPGAIVKLGTNGAATGVVKNVAPSVSADTKQGQIDIDVNNPASSGLVVGQNVQASIAATAPANMSVEGSSATAGSISYILPIQDIKIIPGAAYIYTLDANSKIVSHAVTLGNVRGDFVQVTSGITDDMKIVTPVYELEEGQTVIAQ